MRGRGYSIIELTIVMIIVGILAVAMALQVRSRNMHKLRAAAENPLQGSDTPDNPWRSQTAHCNGAGVADDVSDGVGVAERQLLQPLVGGIIQPLAVGLSMPTAPSMAGRREHRRRTISKV